MNYLTIQEISDRELIPGFHFKLFHSKNMTFSFIRIEKGAELPEHHHQNEQVTIMQKGKLELTLEGKTHILEPGSILHIPSNAIHSGVALTDCEALDVFHPVREDYR